jgi:ATP-dependent Clp protease adaptor protein ClpS
MPDDTNPSTINTVRETGGTATQTKAGTKGARKKAPARKPPQMLPPWKVLLHNDDQNDIYFVETAIVSLTPLNQQAAAERTREAHRNGLALLLTTHKERAELYQEQFQSKGLTVTIEPAE